MDEKYDNEPGEIVYNPPNRTPDIEIGFYEFEELNRFQKDILVSIMSGLNVVVSFSYDKDKEKIIFKASEGF